MRQMTAFTLFANATKYVCFAAAASALAFIAAEWLLSRRPPACPRHHVLAFALAAMWSPALVMFGLRGSPWVLLAASVMTAILTVGMNAHVERSYRSNAGTAFGSSLLIHGTVGLASTSSPIWAVLPASLAASLLTARYYAHRARPIEPCTSLHGCTPVMLLMSVSAVTLTAAALLPHLGHHPPGEPGESGLEALLPTAPPDLSPSAPIEDDGHAGIIIWPEVKPTVTLVAPLPSLAPKFGRTNASDPLSIPFFGAYWIYRAPHKQPPPQSLVVHGSPADRKFFSTDHLPLNMEARQNLGSLFPLQLLWQHRPRRLERRHLRWNNRARVAASGPTADSEKPSLSLGRVPFPGPRAPLRLVGTGRVTQPLSFPIPATASIRQFDEIAVIYHLDSIRAYRAARVAVERFVLNPRRR
jgi:hypothetical protein